MSDLKEFVLFLSWEVYLLANFPTPHPRPARQNNNNRFELAEYISSGFQLKKAVLI